MTSTTLSRRAVLAGAALLAGPAAALAHPARAWPSRPLRLIVGFPAGSSPRRRTATPCA